MRTRKLVVLLLLVVALVAVVTWSLSSSEVWRTRISKLDPNWFIVGLTIALVFVAVAELLVNHTTLKHERVIERAYIDMSHAPPGFYCLKSIDTPHPVPTSVVANEPIAVRVQVTNHGHTPADVTATVITMHIGKELPDVPPYTDHKTWGAFFLMPNGGRFFVNGLVHSGIKDEDMALIQAEKLFMWAVGYVDYTDVFKKRHRAGYARRYSPRATDNNNLVFETKPGYNYDRDR